MKKAMIYGMFLVLTGCSSLPHTERLLERQEKELGTNGSTTMLFHSTLYYPSEISLTFPGFILGIEKSPVYTVAEDAGIYIKDVPESGFTKEQLRDEIVDNKILYVSHIIESFGNPYGQGNCAHYNAYYRKGLNIPKQPKPSIEFCMNSEEYEVAPDRAYADSWLAMSRLRDLVNERIASHTHVVVVTMGWNTVQEEAVRNFNSIMKNLKAAAEDKDDAFRPLFIGVTWPSQWAAKWVEPIVRAVSFPWKSHDADEVGLTWLGVLLHETLSNIDKPIVVIGHSFGARATSVAACIGPAITAEKLDRSANKNTIDVLINLQGAYRANRIMGQHVEGKLRYDCSNVKRIFLTSSINDTAMDTLSWRKDKYAGDDESYNRYCGNGRSEIRCGVAYWNGNLSITNESKSNMTYIDSDDLIKVNSYLSGGDAHSDIYRAEHGVMLWNMLSRNKD